MVQSELKATQCYLNLVFVDLSVSRFDRSTGWINPNLAVSSRTSFLLLSSLRSIWSDDVPVRPDNDANRPKRSRIVSAMCNLKISMSRVERSHNQCNMTFITLQRATSLWLDGVPRWRLTIWFKLQTCKKIILKLLYKLCSLSIQHYPSVWGGPLGPRPKPNFCSLEVSAG